MVNPGIPPSTGVMAQDDSLMSFQFADSRSRSSSISQNDRKALVPVGRIIHRVDLACRPSTDVAPRGRRPDEQNSSSSIRSLVPLDDRDVPYFCPDTKHTASLHRVSNVYQELNTERAWLVTENDKVTRQKRMVIEELRELELTLKQLMERKGVLQKGLETLQTKEDSSVTQIEALDKKIGLIGEKSVEFEEMVRDIAGSPQYELGPDLQAIEHGELDAGRCWRVLEGHTAAVCGLGGGGGDASQIYSCGQDASIRVWDTSMFECTKMLSAPGNDAALNCLSVRDGFAAVGNSEGEVALWNVGEHRNVSTMQCHQAPVQCLQIEGNCIVTGSTDYTAQVWNLESGKCDRRLEGHTGSVTCLMAREISADYPLCLATGSMDGTVKFWDARQANCQRDWQVDQGGVVGLAFDDKYLFTADTRGTLKVWDLRASGALSSVNLGAPISCFAKSGEGGETVLVAGTTTGKIHVCAMVADVLKPMPTKLEGHTGRVSSICLADGGSTVWSGGADSTVRMWRTERVTGNHLKGQPSNSTFQANFFGFKS